ncbi:molybdopterin-dependent oxidoreductase [Vulcanisaeta souniana]|uniref:molybdopterin-dependent oxidoreductase n=1 Tax=Vulcanisaeta souniana TaxID=164452 RepID=UPI0006D0F457|nr:molybdopterin-dependent oxidoreductase [Vulcanisaeta souniana]
MIEAKRNGTKIVVIDPRTTATAKMADLHLKPIPSTEVYLFNAVANYLINNELIDRDFIVNRTENFEKYAKVASKYSINDAEKITGVPRDLILKFAQLIATKPVLFTWGGLGMSESSGVDDIKSYIALANDLSAALSIVMTAITSLIFAKYVRSRNTVSPFMVRNIRNIMVNPDSDKPIDEDYIKAFEEALSSMSKDSDDYVRLLTMLGGLMYLQNAIAYNCRDLFSRAVNYLGMAENA